MKGLTKGVWIIIWMIAILVGIKNLAIADTMLPSDAFQKAEDHAQEEYVTKTQSVAATVIAVIQIVGITTAVAMLMILAIKYMRMGPEGKADIKHSMTTYIIGAIILFGATGFLQILKNAISSMGKIDIKDVIDEQRKEIHGM